MRPRMAVPVVVVLIAMIGVGGGYLIWAGISNQGQSAARTVTSASGPSNTYVSCMISAAGFEFRVVSDSSGAPVSGESMEAVDRLGCNGQSQVVYLDSFSPPTYCCNFTEANRGWLVPDFPLGATWGGGLAFTVDFHGKAYNFTADIPPVGTNCVTLHVPSGNVNSTTVMNDRGSYC